MEVLIDKDDLWVLLWYGLPSLTIDEEELGGYSSMVNFSSWMASGSSMKP